MTGRGTPVTTLESAESLTGLLQGVAQGSHQLHRLGGHPQLRQWKTLSINSPSRDSELLPT